MYLSWYQIFQLLCSGLTMNQQQQFCFRYHQVKSDNDHWLNSDDLYIFRHYNLNVPLYCTNRKISSWYLKHFFVSLTGKQNITRSSPSNKNVPQAPNWNASGSAPIRVNLQSIILLIWNNLLSWSFSEFGISPVYFECHQKRIIRHWALQNTNILRLYPVPSWIQGFRQCNLKQYDKSYCYFSV